MGVKIKGLAGWWMAALLSVSSLAASGDLRLVEAVQKGNKEAVRILLQQADVNAPQADGATALHWAAHRDDLETAELLIRAGANLNAANFYGVTALSLACTNRSAAMVEKLLEAGTNPSAAQLTGETALMTCARTGNLDAVKGKPAMLVSGDMDFGIAPEFVRADFRALYPEAPVVPLPGVGHFCQEDVPATLVALIQVFVQANP